jgi:hypothetical protein
MPDRAALVTALILDRPTCLPCIAGKSGLSVADLGGLIDVIAKVLVLHVTTDRCRVCGAVETVHHLDRPHAGR